MTQEEKAKAYDEALEKARMFWENDNDNTLDIKAKGTMEHLFPELRESESERIKNTLIRFHKSTIDIDGIKGDEIVSWLEKQDANHIEENLDMVKPAWSEDYTERMGQIINYLTCQAKEEPTRRKTLLGWVMLLKSIFRKGLPEIQIPCTEAARKGIHRIMDVLEWAADKGRISDSDCEDYMILLSAYLPQQKSSWSEEDESMYTRVIGILGKCYMGQLPTKVEEELNWLKSFRNKL